MEFLTDPNLLFGLGSLILLEIILGIDNLIFVAIIADKLPKLQRDKARIIGLSCALIMRIMMLFSVSWIASLTEPIFYFFTKQVSARDMLLIAGGFFLLFKAVSELHERLTIPTQKVHNIKMKYSFLGVVSQIILIDMVFSIDSVITAIGMVEELSIMIIAVIVAVITMMVASKPLANFINQHHTIIILCLGFLLMIGFSLIIEGLGIHIPKTYIYTAIGFSIFVELLNQLSISRQKKSLTVKRNLRAKIVSTINRLLGGKEDKASKGIEPTIMVTKILPNKFLVQERKLISKILNLSDIDIISIMNELDTATIIAISDDEEVIKKKLINRRLSRPIIVHDAYSQPIGAIEHIDLLSVLVGGLDITSSIKQLLQPLIVIDTNKPILATLSDLKKQNVSTGFIQNSTKHLIGFITTKDITNFILQGL